jgi:hypothetical protein
VFFRRERILRRVSRVRLGRTRTGLPLAEWLHGTGSAQRVAEAMRGMPADAALTFATELRDLRISPSMRPGFAAALRNEPWVVRTIAAGTSRRWWRRLDAARMLGIVGTVADSGLLRPLFRDPHPAVRIAATAALAAVDDPHLVEVVVVRYPQEPLAVRLFAVNTLKAVWRMAEGPLERALASNAPAASLAAWLNLAESLDLPSLRPAVTALVRHPDPEVRAPAARALRRYPHADSVTAVLGLLDDPQDFVRAAGAQALGVLRANEALPQLERGLTDPAWWVRFRCALALALLGESGRAALRRTRQSPDRFARDMAEMASGLSDGAVLELADA